MLITADTDLSEILNSQDVNDILDDSFNGINGIVSARIDCLEDSISNVFSKTTFDGSAVISNKAGTIVNDYYTFTSSVNTTYESIKELAWNKELEELQFLEARIRDKIELLEDDISYKKKQFERYSEEEKAAHAISYTAEIKSIRAKIMEYENKLLQVIARENGSDVVTTYSDENYDLYQDLTPEELAYEQSATEGNSDTASEGSFTDNYSAFDNISSGYVYGADEARAYLQSLGYSHEEIEKAIEMANDIGRIDITKPNTGTYPEPEPNTPPSVTPTPAPADDGSSEDPWGMPRVNDEPLDQSTPNETVPSEGEVSPSPTPAPSNSSDTPETPEVEATPDTSSRPSTCTNEIPSDLGVDGYYPDIYIDSDHSVDWALNGRGEVSYVPSSDQGYHYVYDPNTKCYYEVNENNGFDGYWPSDEKGRMVHGESIDDHEYRPITVSEMKNKISISE